MWVSIALVIILMARMAYAFYAQKCCAEAWDHKVHWSELLGFLITGLIECECVCSRRCVCLTVRAHAHACTHARTHTHTHTHTHTAGITIFVVAVPEGLPLAVTIALAFSVKKMLKDQNLVRHLSACETMGGATTICSDKTGTLTTSRMTVVKAWCGGSSYDAMKTMASKVAAVKEKLATAAVVNTLFKTILKKNPNGTLQYCGNDTECALLIMSGELGHQYEEIRTRFPENQVRVSCTVYVVQME